MYASALFHKKSRKKRKSKRGGGNSCCPVIRVKCARGKNKGSPAAAGESLHARLAKFKAAKAAVASAASSAAGPRGSLGGWRDIVPGVTANALARATTANGKCTITMGGRKYKGLTGAQATRKVAELVRALKAKRCIATVTR